MLPDQSPCYRYPGTKPFEAAEHELFKGRDNDINYLSELVSLQNLVVLFGRSGLGKSSLLNAGLVNCLRKDPTVMVLFVRFGAYYDQNTLSPLARLQAQISGESGTDGSNFIYNKLIPEKEITLHHLWYAFKNFQLTHPEQQTVVLIFDQFEELFTYPEKEIDVFKKELSELLYISVPQQLRNLLKDRLLLDPAYLTREEKELLFRPLNVKVLFSIRSDKLSLLNTLTDFFPSVLNSCYELKPLNRQQARQAIEEPAKLEDRKYISAPFLFTEEAIALLLNTLTEVKHNKDERNTEQKPEIETFQLQIVCKHAENLVMEKGLRQITVSNLGNIKEIFENHYRNLIAKIHPDQQLPARRLIEEKLIIDGNRVSMPIPFILQDEGMTTELLDELINTHILRREQNNTVEISHDTLVEPILKYYEERKKEEAIAVELREKEEQLNKVREEQQKELAAQKLKAKRNRVLLSIISVALILTIGLAAYALNTSHVANQQKKIAEDQSRRADSSAKIATLEKDKAESSARVARKEKDRADSSTRQAILEQQKAEIQKKKADSIARIAMAALQEANIQKRRADSNALEAINKAQLAEAQRQKNEAFRLITVARYQAGSDPTVAMRIAESAIDKSSDSLVQKEAQHIFETFKGEGYYKLIADTLPLQPLSFSPSGDEIIGESGLWQMKEKTLRPFKEYTGAIRTAVFSPDRKKILTGSYDDTVRLWNTDGELLRKFPLESDNARKRESKGAVPSVAFSPDGKKIFAGYIGYGAADLWDTSGKLLWKMEEKPGSLIRFGAFSPDGKTILTGPYNDTTGLWNTDDRSLVQALKEMENTEVALFSPDGQSMLTNKGLWKKEDDEPSWKFDYSTTGSLHCIAFSPDGRRIATASGDNVAQLWNTKDGKFLRAFSGHAGEITAVAFTPDGQSIITSGKDRTVRAWHIYGAPLKEFEIEGTDKFDRFTSMAFSPNSNSLLTVSRKDTVALWNFDGKLVRAFPAQSDTVTVAALSPDGTKVFTGASSGTGRSFNREGATPFKEWNIAKGDAITAASFSQDGNKILTANKDSIKLWNINGSLLKGFAISENWDPITSVAISPDENSVLVGTTPVSYRNMHERATLWSINGTKIRQFGQGASGAFSPDGKKVLIGRSRFPYGASAYTTDGTHLVDFETDDAIISVGFSPDGKKVFTGSTHGLVRVWESAMTMEEFLQSNQLHQLTEKQKKEFGIR